MPSAWSPSGRPIREKTAAAKVKSAATGIGRSDGRFGTRSEWNMFLAVSSPARGLWACPNGDFNENYDFEGKVALEDVPEWKKHAADWNRRVANTMVPAMLQSAFKDRCKLKAHLVPATTKGYALVMSKRGPDWKELKLANPDDQIPPDVITVPLWHRGRMAP
jgi:Protein of unknown function (DUF3738)